MKKLIALLLALAMVFALAACGGKTDDNSANSQNSSDVKDQLDNQEIQQSQQEGPKQDETYVRDEIVLSWDSATSLVPWGTRNNTPGNYEVYEMLYECDAKGEMYPLLADATYEGSYMPGMDHEAGTGVYTVKIYDYIKDHAGNAITASDVAYSFNYQFENESTSGWNDFQGAEATDDTTVVLTFAKEQSDVGQLLNVICRCFIVSEKAHTESDSKLANEMIGTGPYKMESYTSGSEVVLVKNDNYWQTNEELRHQESQANVEKIVYKFIDEASQRVIGLKTGDLDYGYNMSADDVADFMDGGEYADQYNVYSYAQKFVYALHPNCDSSNIMSDVNMRLAVFNAIDQDGLITALGGTNVRLNGYASSYYSDYDWVAYDSMDNYNTKTGVDSDAVKSYLEAAGYQGQTLRLYAASNLSDAATIVAAQLTAQGISCEATALDTNSYNAILADASSWDLVIQTMAGDFNVTVWSHGFAYANTATADHTMFFQTDDEWEAMLNTCLTEAGHTPENMTAWWNHAVENAYVMSLYTGNQFDIIPEDMTYYCLGDKLTPLPGASTYAAPEA